jgi:hypothetical protein
MSGDDGEDVFGREVGRGCRGGVNGDESRRVEAVVGYLREGGVLGGLVSEGRKGGESEWKGGVE